MLFQFEISNVISDKEFSAIGSRLVIIVIAILVFYNIQDKSPNLKQMGAGAITFSPSDTFPVLNILNTSSYKLLIIPDLIPYIIIFVTVIMFTAIFYLFYITITDNINYNTKYFLIELISPFWFLKI